MVNYKFLRSFSLKILVGDPSGDIFMNILPSKDQQQRSKLSLHILFAWPMTKHLWPVRFSLIKMWSFNSGMDTGHLGNTLDIFTVLSLVLALYSLVLTLWLANLTIIAVLLLLLLRWCDISISFDEMSTSNALAIARTASSVELYASFGTPWISRLFFLVYCSKLLTGTVVTA